MKICFMFPGQGSQKPNMGISLVGCSKKAKEVFECASDVFHFNFFDLCSNEQNFKKLSQTRFAQPAIVAVSLAAFSALIEKGVCAQAVVGHSLGSISAMIAAEVVSLEDGFRVVKARAEAMQQCENEGDGAMCAIVGANLSDVELACSNADDYVVCANYNGVDQIVVSGKKAAVEQVAEKLSEKARRCVFLNVEAAFHSKLMEKAIKPFKSALSSIDFGQPKLKLFSNVTGDEVKFDENIKNLIVRQLVSPVLFTKNLQNLDAQGFEVFVELGPSRPLCSMVRKTLKGAQLIGVEDEQTLNEAITKLEI